MTNDAKRETSLVSRWRRAGMCLLYAITLTFVAAFLIDALILRGCSNTHSCSPEQNALGGLVVLLLVAGILVIGVLSWNGRLPGTRRDRDRSDGPVLHRSSVVAVVLLSLFSAGFYVPIWFQRRRDALNSPAKLWEWGSPLTLVFQTVFVAVPADTTLSTMAQIAAGVTVLVLSFRVRSILADHAAAKVTAVLPSSLGVQSLSAPSSLLTRFFNIWYLQYKISELIVEGNAWDQAAAAEGHESECQGGL